MIGSLSERKDETSPPWRRSQVFAPERWLWTVAGDAKIDYISPTDRLRGTEC